MVHTQPTFFEVAEAENSLDILVEFKARTHHGPVGVGAAHGGAAGRGWAA